MLRSLVILSLLTVSALARAEPPAIVAAENMYGDVAGQVAGPGAKVTSILTNPDVDPHLFEASPSTARDVSGARIAVVNGAGYDPWMVRLLRASRVPGRTVIVVADLMGRKAGDNPHLWYDPATMPVVAKALADALAKADPVHAADYQARAAGFTDSMKPMVDKVAAMRGRWTGQAVVATEPVFGLLAAAIGLDVRQQRFALAVQNDAEPRPSDVAAFEADLRGHTVRALIYNSQATNRAAQRMVGLAQRSGVPVVPVTETAPPAVGYVAWMTGQLDALDRALAK